MAHTGAMATVPQSCNLLNPVVFCANEVTLLFLTIILSIINLQCCASFSCTTKLIRYTHTYIHSFLDSFPI